MDTGAKIMGKHCARPFCKGSNICDNFKSFTKLEKRNLVLVSFTQVLKGEGERE